MGVPEKFEQTESYKATEVLVEGIGLIPDTDPFTAKVGTAGIAMIGVSEHPAAIGDQVNVVLDGMCKALGGAAITIHALVMMTTGGKFITATATNVACGRAETACAGDGKYFSIRIFPGASIATPA